MGARNPRTLKSAGMEVWVGVKCQSNLEIAGSLRNSFRASLKVRVLEGRALIGLGAPTRLPQSSQTPNANDLSLGGRLRVIRSVVERETAQTAS